MTWQHDPATENQPAAPQRLDAEYISSAPGIIASLDAPPGPAGPEIKVGKRMATVAGKGIEVFTMTLGGETIELLPLKTWQQLDVYKWRVRGVLPKTPAGLDVAFDHLKLLGHTVLPQEPDACDKLEKLFSEWLAMERETLELARRKAQAKSSPAAQGVASAQQDSTMRFQVSLDKEGMVHIQCLKGKEVLTTIGLNAPGFQSLVNQGWMRKPHSLKAGALHDWVEIDGCLFSFEKGNDESAALEKALNEVYLPQSTGGTGNEVGIYANAASATGFDIQFPAKVGGVFETRRRPLGEESLRLLQDTEHCGVIPKNLVIKLSPPTLIFKQKTPDGGERYLDSCEANTIRVQDDEGTETVIDLSHPVNYSRLNSVELTALFNHPAVNRQARTTSRETPQPKSVQAAPPPAQPHPSEVLRVPLVSARPAPPKAEPEPHLPPKSLAIIPPPKAQEPTSAQRPIKEPPKSILVPPAMAAPRSAAFPQPGPAAPAPNLWVKPLLEQTPMPFEWFTCLVYERIATWFGNSNQGEILGNHCWFVQLAEAEDPAQPDFRAIYDTQNEFGFISGVQVFRFQRTRAYLGTTEWLLEGPDVHPVAVGVDADGLPVFIVADGYRPKFGVPLPDVATQLAELKGAGAILMGVKEALASRDAIEVLWTVPAEQPDPAQPQALETLRPESAS